MSTFGYQALLVLLLVGFFMPLYQRWALKKQIVDVPDHRTSHQYITPRGGGLVFMIAWLVSLSLGVTIWPTWMLLAVIVPTTAILFLGFGDDIVELSPKLRLAAQLLISYGFIYYLEFATGRALSFAGLPHPVVSVLFSLSVAWGINLHNFMDGTDGIASIEGLWVLVPAAILLMAYDAWPLVQMMSLLSLGLIVFLKWNWPKASLFMGDGGSYSIGAIIALMAVIAYHQYGVSLSYWVMLYGAFWFDATVTLFRRIGRRQPFWQPHKLHAYQRLHQAGLSHLAILGIISILNILICTLVVFVHNSWLSEFSGLSLTLMILAIYYLIAERLLPL